MTRYKTDWICTDTSTGQYGRQLSPFLYQFYEEKEEPVTIDVSAYTNGHIENIINSYGYTLERTKKYFLNIFKQYPDKRGSQSATWVIAECIFESEEASLKDINK